MICVDKNAENYLQCIVGTPLEYGIKRSDFDLFQLGFGECISVEQWKNKVYEINKYALHLDSALFLYWKYGNTDRLYPDAKEIEFNSAISKLIGARVKRIALSEKNDLWIEFEDCKMVIVTRDDEEESWRFFQPRTAHPHLIASSASLTFDGD